MQLHLKQLPQHLKGALLPVYLISGETPLLMQEARDAIREAARLCGYASHIRLDVEPGFDWGPFTRAARNFSLFDDKTFIELHNPETKFDANGVKILLDYLKSPPLDKILLIKTTKLSSAQQKSAWHQAVMAQGAVLPIWPVKATELPQWIQGRLHAENLKADAAAVRLLAEYTEGNLLATQQAITKLRLLYPQQRIGVKEMGEAVSDSAQFNVFELSQRIVQRDACGALRVLYHLHAQGVEAALVLWLLSRESRTKLNTQKKALDACHEADKMIKGVSQGDPWHALARIILLLTGRT